MEIFQKDGGSRKFPNYIRKSKRWGLKSESGWQKSEYLQMNISDYISPASKDPRNQIKLNSAW